MIVIAAVVVLAVLSVVLLVRFFPAAVVTGVAGAALSWWARGHFPAGRQLFTGLAAVCIVIAVASLALDLTLLAADGGEVSTTVRPLPSP